MSERAWCEVQADGTYTVYLDMACPNGEVFRRTFPCRCRDEAIERLKALQGISEYRHDRFGVPRMVVEMI